MSIPLEALEAMAVQAFPEDERACAACCFNRDDRQLVVRYLGVDFLLLCRDCASKPLDELDERMLRIWLTQARMREQVKA